MHAHLLHRNGGRLLAQQLRIGPRSDERQSQPGVLGGGGPRRLRRPAAQDGQHSRIDRHFGRLPGRFLDLVQIVERHQLHQVTPAHAAALVPLPHRQPHGVQHFVSQVPVQPFKRRRKPDLDRPRHRKTAPTDQQGRKRNWQGVPFKP